MTEPKKEGQNYFFAEINSNFIRDINDVRFPKPLYLSRSNCKRIVDLLNTKDPRFGPMKVSRGVMAKLPKPETKVQSKKSEVCKKIPLLVKRVTPKKPINVAMKRPVSPEQIPSTSWQDVSSYYKPPRDEQILRKKATRYNPVVEVVECSSTKTSYKSTPPSPPPCLPAIPQRKKAFQAVYGVYKPYKKNKEWTYDGFILTQPGLLILYDCSGKIVGRTERGQEMSRVLESDMLVVIGKFECQLCDQISLSDFESGAFFADDAI